MAKKKIIERNDDELEQEMMVDLNAASAKMPSNLSQGRQSLYDYMEIPCEQIVPFTKKEQGKDFSRMSDDIFAALVKSVSEHGVLEAISVRMIDYGKYEILSGEHRWNASIKAGLKTVPAKVYKNISDEKANIIFTVTNLIRREMTFSDKVNGWHRFLENTNKQGARTDLKDTLESERDSLNISIRQIQRYARMYNLLTEYKTAVDEGKLTQSAAYQLSFLSYEQQKQVLEYLPKLDEKKATELVRLAKENLLNDVSTVFEKSIPEHKSFSKAMSNIKKYAKKTLNDNSLNDIDTIFEEALEMYLQAHPENRR